MLLNYSLAKKIVSDLIFQGVAVGADTLIFGDGPSHIGHRTLTRRVVAVGHLE